MIGAKSMAAKLGHQLAGRVVHKALTPAMQASRWADRNPYEAQQAVLQRLAQQLQHTDVATLQDPSIWTDLTVFKRRVRLTTHADYQHRIAQGMTRPRAGTFERKATRRWATSSSGVKYTPYTDAHVANLRSFQTTVLAQAVIARGLDAAWRRPVFAIQGALETQTTANGMVKGYSTALVMNDPPRLLRGRIAPSLATLRAPSLQARVDALTDALIAQRPGTLTGTPDYLVGMIRRMLDGPREVLVREALSEVAIYAWAGSSVEPHRRFLESVLSPDCVYFDALSATEAPMGVQAEREGIYRLALNHTLFVFVSTEDPRDRRLASELTPGESYKVAICSPAGYVAYETGDVIRVVSHGAHAPLRVELCPRGLNPRLVSAMLGGVTDFCCFRDPQTGHLDLLLEGRRQPSLNAVGMLADHLGAASARARLVDSGALSRQLVALAVPGPDAPTDAKPIIKLPRLHEDRALHERLLAGLGLASSRDAQAGGDAQQSVAPGRQRWAA